MNRLIKHNILLILVVSLSVIAACVLLVWIAMEHSEMSGYMKETDTLRTKIKELIEKTPAPVEGNKAPIQFNTRLYARAADELEKHFGHPLQDALVKFIETIRLREPRDGKNTITLEQFRQEFREGWGNGERNNAQQGLFYKEFQRKFVNWADAMREFSNVAKTVTLEPISEFTIDDIFRSALGLERMLPDEGQAETVSRFVMDYRSKLMETLGNKVTVSPQAANFSFDIASFDKENTGGTPAPGGFGGFGGFGGGEAAASSGVTVADYTLIAKHLDVIGEIMQHLLSSGVKELTMFRKRSLAGETVGSYLVFHYSFEVVGTMESIRKLVKSLDEGFRKNRLFVVRSVFLYAMSDPARELFEPEALTGESEDDNTRVRARQGRGRRGQVMNPMMQPGMMGPGMVAPGAFGGVQESEEEMRAREAAELQARIEREKKLPMNERTGYGKVIIGGDKSVRALIDVDYVMQNTTN